MLRKKLSYTIGDKTLFLLVKDTSVTLSYFGTKLKVIKHLSNHTYKCCFSYNYSSSEHVILNSNEFSQFLNSFQLNQDNSLFDVGKKIVALLQGFTYLDLRSLFTLKVVHPFK